VAELYVGRKLVPPLLPVLSRLPKGSKLNEEKVSGTFFRAYAAERPTGPNSIHAPLAADMKGKVCATPGDLLSSETEKRFGEKRVVMW